MNILVVSKSFNSKSRSADIQVSRIIDTLVYFGQNSVLLVTEGTSTRKESTKNLEVHYIKKSQFRRDIIYRIFDRIFCYPGCLIRNNFFKKGFQVTREIINERHFDILLTISTPFDAHLIGLEIKREFSKIKWITLFTDLWPTLLLPEPYKRRKIGQLLEMKLMRRVVTRCDGFISQTKYTNIIIESTFNTKNRNTVIPHIMRFNKKEYENQIKGYIVHSGSIQKERIKKDLVEAIKELANEPGEFKGLVQIGSYSARLVKMIKRFGCNNIYLVGKLPEEIALSIQSMFEVGLIIEAPIEESDPFLPGKITDNLQLNRKIIAITPQNSYITDLAKEEKGIFCTSYNKKEIKKCIMEAFSSRQTIDKKTTSLFSPAIISEQYLRFFVEILNSDN